MSRTDHPLKIDYIEFPATDIPRTKEFYAAIFGWTFEDYGPEYTCFKDGRLRGGFYHAPPEKVVRGALVVLYSADLEKTEEEIKPAGGIITRATFSFPGGRRFHFHDPSGNELAVWSDAKD